MSYFPIALPFLLILSVISVFLFVLIEIGILKYAYERIGINRRYIFLLLFLSLLGSYINIPLFRLPPEFVQSGKIIDFFGMEYVVPMVKHWPGTVIAVNVGGAVIPVCLSLYLILKNRLLVRSLVAVGIVTLIVHHLAYPVPGVGIAEPLFIPPLAATITALLLSWRNAPALAYIAGSLGTLIGADLLNLGRIHGLGAPVASIGGAGTFDGIFLTGILAVLIAGIVTPRKRTT